jgi:hypothetical protein
MWFNIFDYYETSYEQNTKFQMSLFENAGTYQEFFKRRWENFWVKGESSRLLPYSA